jgi:Periplasmic binding protein
MRRIVFSVAAVVLSAAFTLPSPAALATSNPSEEEAAGRALFLTGRTNQSEPYAIIGAADVKVRATAIPCASCHGRDGHGKAERGIVPPNITWPALSAPYGEPGRHRPPYSDATVVRAVTMGLDAGGNRLDPVMPRFQLAATDAASLLAYLKRLGTLPEPGLNEHRLTLGIVLDPDDREAGPLLSAYFGNLNHDGGVFGRQLELRIEHPPPGEGSGRTTAQLINSDTIFTVLAPEIAGDERAAVEAADADGMPVVGPLTPDVQTAPRSRYVFYLNGGMAAEARALAGFAATLPGSPSINDDGVSGWHAAAAALPQPAHTDNRGPILWFARRPPDQNDLATRTAILMPGVLAPSVLSNGAPLPTWLAYASGPPDFTPDAATEYRALAEGQDLPIEPGPRQRHALAAAKIIVEALRRSGRDVSRERLIDALETIQDFHTGLVPPVSFSTTRRIGSDGAWIVPLNGGEPIWWDR